MIKGHTRQVIPTLNYQYTRTYVKYTHALYYRTLKKRDYGFLADLI